MNLSIISLKTDRQWRSATGLDQKRFSKLLTWFEQSYEQMYGRNIDQRQAECPEQPALSTYTDLLLFTLFSFKLGLSYDLLGFTTGMDGSTAKRNQDLDIAVLEHTLVASGHAPKRSFASVEEFKEYFKSKGTIQLEQTVRTTHSATQRPRLPKVDAGRIDAVTLAPGQAQAPFQLQRADHCVGNTLLLQKAAQGQRVVICILHAQKAIAGTHPLLFQPNNQLLEARHSISKLLVGELVRVLGPVNGRVKSGLGDVDSDNKFLVHSTGGLGEKSRAEFTEMLIPARRPPY